MRAAHCRRVWEVEAVRDGMLATDAEMACVLHVAHCEDCRAERGRLTAIADGLALLPADPDELALRRLRERMLECADGWSRRRKNHDWRGLLLLAGTCIALLSLWVVHGARSSAQKTAPTGRAMITAVGDARWSRHEAPTLDRIELTEGELHFVVRGGAGAPRLLVHVPDGDIEDLGTTFAIAVRRGRTERVSVEEGRVVFRRTGRDPVFLNAGDAWIPEIDPGSGIDKVLEGAPPESAGKEGGTTNAARPRKARPANTPAIATAPIQEGEDAAYLRVVALLKEGRSVEARAAARNYLDRFPDGFRRREIRAVAESLTHPFPP